MAEQLSSPLSTGGAGVIFEYRVAAIMFSRLLRGAHIPVGVQMPLARVALQQRNSGYPLDDIVAYAEPLGSAPSIQIQVKRSLRVTSQDTEFIKVITAALGVCQTRAEDVRSGQLLLGLAARAPVADLEELAALAEMAQAHADPDGLQDLLREGITSSKLRARFEHVVSAVASTASTSDRKEATHLAHGILTGLHVWHVLAGPDDRDWRLELDHLSGVASGTSKTAADLMDHLYVIAQEFGPRSGLVDRDHLHRVLLSRFGVRLSPPDASTRGPAGRINIVNNGSGTVIAGESQVFYGLRVGN